MSILEDIVSRARPDYQRDNFDAFLKKVGFSYNIPSIHVTGTNGKGSIGYLLEHSLANSKIKTGRFLSPAVTDEREIILVNGKMVPKTVWERFLSEIILRIEDKDLKATAFEIEFVLSLLIFKELNCELVILE